LAAAETVKLKVAEGLESERVACCVVGETVRGLPAGAVTVTWTVPWVPCPEVRVSWAVRVALAPGATLEGLREAESV
jgi:hypothetical protein